MQTDCISDFERLFSLHASDWRRLASESGAATVFQTPEWVAACWRHFGKGRRLRAFVFREEEAVVGLAVCYLPSVLAPLRPLRFVGEGVSDYLDFVAAPGYEDEVAAALGEVSRAGREWDAADFAQIRPAANARRIPGASPLVGETCPYLTLPDDWETFRRGLPKKLRSNIGYYERALAKRGELEFRVASEETLPRDLAAFFALHQQRWRRRGMPGAFAAAKMRAFHEDAARALLAGRLLRLHTLSLDGDIKAALYCFQKGATCYYYLGGFAAELSRLSPGTVLTARALRHALENDAATEFDFLRGNEPYKYAWGAVDRFNNRLVLPRPGLRGRILQTTAAATLRAELRLKDWLHGKNEGARRETTRP